MLCFIFQVNCFIPTPRQRGNEFKPKVINTFSDLRRCISASISRQCNANQNQLLLMKSSQSQSNRLYSFIYYTAALPTTVILLLN